MMIANRRTEPAAAEPAEQGALADAGHRRDFVHGDRVWAAPAVPSALLESRRR
jgi:hypothetical protein